MTDKLAGVIGSRTGCNSTMRLVSMKVGGKDYRLQCRPEEEERVRLLGETLDKKVTAIAADSGSPVTDRVLVMVALLLLDEINDLKARLNGSTAPETDSRRTA